MAISFTFLCGLTLLMLSYFGYYFARGYFIEGTETAIDTEIKYIDAFPQILNSPNTNPERLYASFGKDGTRPPEIPQTLSLMTEGIIVFDHTQTGKTFAAKIHTNDLGQKILVGIDITRTKENYDFMMMLSLMGAVMVAAVIIGSFAISVFVARGTNSIAQTARAIIQTGDLSRRIQVQWHWDDLSHVADTLNMLLARIEQLMQGVRHMSDNIAHDLRTPLTRIKTSINALIEQNPNNESLIKLSAEADHILGVFNALLRITKLETENRRSHFQSLRLDQLLQDVVEYYEPLAEEKSIHLKLSLFEQSIKGDPDLLFQAFANILDNAVKYTPKNGEIEISMRVNNKMTEIEIYNSGSTLKPEDLERIFDRFFRSETCRSAPGTGLGLSLSQAVVHLHNGTIKAENKNAGFSIITII